MQIRLQVSCVLGHFQLRCRSPTSHHPQLPACALLWKPLVGAKQQAAFEAAWKLDKMKGTPAPTPTENGPAELASEVLHTSGLETCHMSEKAGLSKF